MTSHEPHGQTSGPTSTASHRHGGHGLMMLACLPLLVIGIVLITIGLAPIGVLVVVGGCVVMMVLMMRGMSRGGDS